MNKLKHVTISLNNNVANLCINLIAFIFSIVFLNSINILIYSNNLNSQHTDNKQFDNLFDFINSYKLNTYTNHKY